MRPATQPFFSFSSSSFNPIYEVFNATLPLHADLRNPALPLHDGSLHLHPFPLAIVPSPSSPSSSSSSPPRHPSLSSSPSSNPTLLLLFFLLQSHHSPSLAPLPSPPILPLSSFSSSSSNPTHKAFNITLPIYADLHDPILPFHSGSLHLRPFSTGNPSFPLLPFLLIPFSFSSSFSLPFPPPPPSPLLPPLPPIPPFFSSSFSINPIHEAFNAALLLHGGSLHLHFFLTGNPFNMKGIVIN